jgi:hypothetical protein
MARSLNLVAKRDPTGCGLEALRELLAALFLAILE